MLHRNGIGGILDYAAEDDMPDDDGPASKSGPNEKVVARTHDYASEEVCDGHMKTFMKSIEAAAEAPGRGFAAIKVYMLLSCISVIPMLLPYSFCTCTNVQLHACIHPRV